MQVVVNTGCLEGDVGQFLVYFDANMTALFELKAACGVAMTTPCPPVSGSTMLVPHSITSERSVTGIRHTTPHHQQTTVHRHKRH